MADRFGFVVRRIRRMTSGDDDAELVYMGFENIRKFISTQQV